VASDREPSARREDIAADYGLSRQQVEQAIDYTKKYRLEAAWAPAMGLVGPAYIKYVVDESLLGHRFREIPTPIYVGGQ
jgi:hypothetical protein